MMPIMADSTVEKADDPKKKVDYRLWCPVNGLRIQGESPASRKGISPSVEPVKLYSR